MKPDAINFYSALANEIRLRCLVLLERQGELCVCELTHALDLSQPMISRHLALLRDAGLVKDRREGQWIYYCIHPALASWQKIILETTAQGNAGQAPFAEDMRKLDKMPNRPGCA